MVHVIGCQLELIEESGKICMVNFQDIKVTYPVGELIMIKRVPDEKAFVHTAKYQAHPQLMEDSNLSLNLKILPDLRDNTVG